MLHDKYAIWANLGTRQEFMICENIYSKSWADAIVKGLIATKDKLEISWTYTIEFQKRGREKSRSAPILAPKP